MSRPKLAVATSFPIHPPRGGGQQRVFCLYRELAACGLTVEVVTLVGRRERASERELAPGLVEVRVPRTREHEEREHEMQRSVPVPISDIALALLHEFTPDYAAALARAARGCTAMIASHPFSRPAIEAVWDGTFIYEAHNVEWDLKAEILRDFEAEELVHEVGQLEGRCCADADIVLTCSEADRDRLRSLYGTPAHKMLVVPNGVDTTAVRFTGASERRRLRDRLGLRGVHAVFLGSWHEPNVAAVSDLLAAARELPDVRFVMMGSAGLAFAGQQLPENVDLCGVVDGGFVHAVLQVADVALNPMRFGSGTNLKMLEYAAAGVPLASSAFGARGLGFEPGVHYLPGEPADLGSTLAALVAEDREVTAARSRAARDRVVDAFDWTSIARRWREAPAMAATLGVSSGPAPCS